MIDEIAETFTQLDRRRRKIRAPTCYITARTQETHVDGLVDAVVMLGDDMPESAPTT